jgi:hypothetical protein
VLLSDSSFAFAAAAPAAAAAPVFALDVVVVVTVVAGAVAVVVTVAVVVVVVGVAEVTVTVAGGAVTVVVSVTVCAGGAGAVVVTVTVGVETSGVAGSVPVVVAKSAGGGGVVVAGEDVVVLGADSVEAVVLLVNVVDTRADPFPLPVPQPTRRPPVNTARPMLPTSAVRRRRSYSPVWSMCRIHSMTSLAPTVSGRPALDVGLYSLARASFVGRLKQWSDPLKADR